MELSGLLYAIDLSGDWELDDGDPQTDVWSEREGDTVNVSVYRAPVGARLDVAQIKRDMRRFLRLGATALRATLPEDAQIGAPRWADEEDVWLAYRDSRSRGRVLTSIVVAAKESIEGDALMAVLTLDSDEGSGRAAAVLETLVIGPAD